MKTLTEHPLTDLLHKACQAVMDKVLNDESLEENIHLSASMMDGWDSKYIFVEGTLADNKPFIFPANILAKSKFDMAGYQDLLTECTPDGLTVEIEIIDVCDITDTMTIGMAWKKA